MALDSSKKTDNDLTGEVTVPLLLRVLGVLFLLVAVATSALLALEHIGGLSLPGCGPGSGCAELANSFWGKVPGTNWPVSFAGVAYFLCLLMPWAGNGRGLPTVLRYVVRLGVLGTVWFLIVMIQERHLCQYCLGVHLGNIAFWIVMECTRARATLSARLLTATCAVFMIVSVALGFVEWRTQQAVAERGEEELAESTAEIIQATTQPRVVTTQAIPESDVALNVPKPPATQQASNAGFRGRYLLGPEKAAVRLVLFTDHQCTDCLRIEQEIRALFERHDDISLSIKYYPFHELCNPTVNRTLHPNACWAARAAEAAGILWGNDGFWAMHHWLFDHHGVFTNKAEINAAIRELGYDPEGFVKVMTGPRTLELIQADIAEANSCGLFQTPMIFINGIELRGWYAKNAIVRAVEQVLATNPQPRTHEHDSPPLMVEKCVGDWRAKRIQRLPPTQYRRALGSNQATVKIVVFGDYQEPIIADLDDQIRAWIAGRTDALYVFRHYPFDQQCNPNVSHTEYEYDCQAVRLAEGAGRLGDEDGFWRMHEWLMRHQEPLTDELVAQAASELGFQLEALQAAMQHPRVEAALQEDIKAGKLLQMKTIPTLFINGRHVSRWRWQGAEKGREIINAILNAAASEKH